MLAGVRQRLRDEKYAAALTASGNRDGTSTRSSVGTTARSTRDLIAGSSPAWVSTAGWMPRASSRNSARPSALHPMPLPAWFRARGWSRCPPGRGRDRWRATTPRAAAGAVVDVPLDPPSLCIRGLHDARPRRPDSASWSWTSAVSRSFSTVRRTAAATEATRPGPPAAPDRGGSRPAARLAFEHSHGTAACQGSSESTRAPEPSTNMPVSATTARPREFDLPAPSPALGEAGPARASRPAPRPDPRSPSEPSEPEASGEETTGTT